MGEFSDLVAANAGAGREALARLSELVLATVPEATEGLSYGAPAFRYRGKPLLGVASNAKHFSLLPFSPAVVEAVADQLGGFSLSKGTIRFTADQPVPDAAVTRMIELRRAEIEK